MRRRRVEGDLRTTRLVFRSDCGGGEWDVAGGRVEGEWGMGLKAGGEGEGRTLATRAELPCAGASRAGERGVSCRWC